MVEYSDHNHQEHNIQTDRPRLPLLQTSRYASSTSGELMPNANASHGLDQPPIPSITVNSTDYVPFQVASPLLEHEQQHRQQSLGSNPVIGPSINVVPPTPMELQHHASSALALNSDVGSQETIMPSSPKVPAPRKQRFTMGPRAGCEKCRLGIKGHFVHLE